MSNDEQEPAASLTARDKALIKAMQERNVQEQLRIKRNWGPLEEEDYHVLNTVLTEETGEVARAILEYDRNPDDRRAMLLALQSEAVQTAAVALQIVEKTILELAVYG